MSSALCCWIRSGRADVPTDGTPRRGVGGRSFQASSTASSCASTLLGPSGFADVNVKPFMRREGTLLGYWCSATRLVCPPPLWRQTNTPRRDSGLVSQYTTHKASAPVVAAGRPRGGRERRVGRWGLGRSGIQLKRRPARLANLSTTGDPVRGRRSDCRRSTPDYSVPGTNFSSRPTTGRDRLP